MKIDSLSKGKGEEIDGRDNDWTDEDELNWRNRYLMSPELEKAIGEGKFEALTKMVNPKITDRDGNLLQRLDQIEFIEDFPCPDKYDPAGSGAYISCLTIPKGSKGTVKSLFDDYVLVELEEPLDDHNDTVLVYSMESTTCGQYQGNKADKIRKI